MGGPANRVHAVWRAGADPLASGHLRPQRDGGAAEAQLGYGFGARRLPGVLTPFGDFGYAAGRRALRLGLRYGDRGDAARSLEVEFAGERSAHGAGLAPVLRLGLRGSLRF